MLKLHVCVERRHESCKVDEEEKKNIYLSIIRHLCSPVTSEQKKKEGGNIFTRYLNIFINCKIVEFFNFHFFQNFRLQVISICYVQKYNRFGKTKRKIEMSNGDI